MDGLLSSVKTKGAGYCTSCYTGNYPVAFPRDQSGYLQLSLKIDGKPQPLPEEEPETVG
jgi:glutamine phosphoribosylpyrophosphate amidotransferase